jgi:hypothetical protein
MEELSGLEEFMKKESEKLYGKIIDMAKVTPLTDRQLEQFVISTKQYVRESFSGVLAVIKELEGNGDGDKEEE